MLRSLAIGLAALGLLMHMGMPASAIEETTSLDASLKVKHRQIEVDGVKIFYREAGREDAPAILLMHGFPASSHMFRHLMPALADQFRVIAPDYPGFGLSDFPAADKFEYTFAHYAEVMDRFTQAIGLRTYTLYIQDYGAPIGLRLALRAPEKVTGLIVQNGNAYVEGLSDGWDPLKEYWRNPTLDNREKLRGWLDEGGTRLQYVAGIPEAQQELFSPDTWVIDWLLLQRPGNIEVQLDLFGDYKTNVALYPDFQKFFRDRRPPTLIVWGKHDPFFTLAGAQAYKRDLPDAELHLLDTGHFALETHWQEVASLIAQFFATSEATQ